MKSSLLRTLQITGLSLVAVTFAAAADPADTSKADRDTTKSPTTNSASDTTKSAGNSTAAAKVQITRPVELIDINTADAAALQRLPGITEEIAAAIIKARPFKNEDELAKVEGVGEARASILKSQIMASTAGDTTSKTDEPKLTPTGRDNPDDQKKPSADATDAPEKHSTDKTSTDKTSSDPTSSGKSSAGEVHKSATDKDSPKQK